MHRPSVRERGVSGPGFAVGAGLVAAFVLTGCATETGGSTVRTHTISQTVSTTITATATVTVTASASAAPVSFAAFRGPWSGHTRYLSISPGGVVTESVSDGCCTPQIRLTLQLSNPSGTAQNARADAEVLDVVVFAGYPDSAPEPPHIGDHGSVTIADGVFTDSWLQITFCDERQATAGTCGA